MGIDPKTMQSPLSGGNIVAATAAAQAQNSTPTTSSNKEKKSSTSSSSNRSSEITTSDANFGTRVGKSLFQSANKAASLALAAVGSKNNNPFFPFGWTPPQTGQAPAASPAASPKVGQTGSGEGGPRGGGGGDSRRGDDLFGEGDSVKPKSDKNGDGPFKAKPKEEQPKAEEKPADAKDSKPETRIPAEDTSPKVEEKIQEPAERRED